MTTAETIIRVAVPLPIDGPLDYLWPGTAPPAAGTRVRVPVGRRSCIGVVIDDTASGNVDPARLKRVIEAIDEEPAIDAALLAALRWCADYYHHPLGEVVSAALPSLLRRGSAAAPEPEIRWQLTPAGRAVDPEPLRRRAPRQARVLDLLADGEPHAATSLKAAGLAPAELARLEQKGWLARSEHTVAEVLAAAPVSGGEPTLTSDQAAALSAIEAAGAGFNAHLLHGVTGSGKTEIYMRLVAAQMRAGRQTLLLVPEISLTPQLVERLEARFGARLAVMHSALTDSERLRAWQACRSGTAGLIVGTRSAVFAPLSNAGLIVVDEEHDSSFKQAEGFRYSARDLAVYRAQQLDIPILLGSATPALESLHNARLGRYRLVELPQRIGAAGAPSLEIIDLNRHPERNGLSAPMLAAIEKHLRAGQQVMLFLNRRGFAPVLFCPECGITEDCARCDARMTIHAAGGRLSCHHCGTERPLSWACPQCGHERIAVGAGTQRVGEELRTRFPDARIARLDRDATSARGSLERVLDDVASGRTQILVGTQMLAKGHDFPNVTLVGMLNADQGLFGTDFRSSERLVQTLIQVAGRAGRADRPGEVLIQSHFPAHPLFACLGSQDYGRFAAMALDERRSAHWPPFSHLVLWRAQAGQRRDVFAFLDRLARLARSRSTPVSVLGPAPAVMERRGGMHRAQLLLQCERRGPLHALVESLLGEIRQWPEARRVRWAVDVDPAEL
jgi:primosomal protein N' (replication factor Y)